MTGAAATVVSRGTLFGVFALVLGAVAGWFSGTTGTVAPTITTATSGGDHGGRSREVPRTSRKRR